MTAVSAIILLALVVGATAHHRALLQGQTGQSFVNRVGVYVYKTSSRSYIDSCIVDNTNCIPGRGDLYNGAHYYVKVSMRMASPRCQDRTPSSTLCRM